MLKILRNKKTAKKIWIALAILIVPAFILWGSGSLIRTRPEPTYAGRIFGKKISFLEYKDALDAARNQAIIQFGENISEIEKALNLESLAWERLLLLYEAKKRKIKASDAEVVGSIKNYPFFQRKGKFDNAIYSEMLQYAFHTQARIFEEQTRQNLIISKLYKILTDNINLTEEEIKEAYRMSNEQISLYYIVSRHADFAKDINPSEEEVRDYFKKNPLKFKQPPSFNLEYVSIAGGSEDDNAIREKIKILLSRLNRNADFIKVSKDFNLTVKETGLFGQTDPIPGIGWSPQILNLVSKSKIGEFLPPIYIDKNYYIFRFKGKKEPHVPEFETIKDKAKEMFIRDKSEEIARTKIEDCLKKLKEEYQINPKLINFDKAAGVFDLKSGSTELFKYGSYIEDIGASDTLWTLAQKLKEGEFSELISLSSGFYIVKLKSKVPVDENKFAAEKTEFSKILLSQKKLEYFNNFVKELKQKTQLF